MSARYRMVQWTRVKLGYDAVLLVLVATYISLYQAIGSAVFAPAQAPSPAILAMRAWGSCAFLLLSAVLCIGPLARLDPRFLPLLYNRRHAGVITCGVAGVHAAQVLGFYYAWGKYPELEALWHFDGDAHRGTLPFVRFGMLGLTLLTLLAATSHDFWQRFFGPVAWKSLHMTAYAAYAAVVMHVAWGALQREDHPWFSGLFGGVVLVVCALHVLAGRPAGEPHAQRASEGVWLDAGPADAFPEGELRSVRRSGGEPICVVRKAGAFHAVHGLCAHQRGPLHEGRLVDGCITCPWHGYQYRPEDGRAPPPFSERLATHRVRVVDGRVRVDPTPAAEPEREVRHGAA